ncbi:flagellar assembly protein FliW [bacterium]|nr:flagellar assembly protein FliW [bacterium]
MKVNTTRFGEVEIAEDKILNFISPIIGYNEYSKFTIVEQENNELFQWLQSLDDPELAFPISIPSYFSIDYNFEIDDTTQEKLQLTDVADLLIYNIVTIPNSNPKGATINLLAPVLINAKTNNAMQYIITNSSYTSRHSLFEQATK